MKVRIAITVLAAAASLSALVPQAQAGELCYSVQATVNGQDVVNQAGCQDLP